MRLDQYLVINNYFNSRAKATEAIKNSQVLVDDKVITKPAYDILNEVKINIINPLKYASRAGLKLEEAIKHYNLDFKDKVVLDIGGSTGGFTSCSLYYEAKKVYSVDVGTMQLAKELKEDKRVISLENTNILTLPKFDDNIDIILMDLSFVSVTKMLPCFNYYLNDNNYLVLLIKPQFEVGNIKLKNGVIKDEKLRKKALNGVLEFFKLNNFSYEEVIESPIKGGSGNIEYLMVIKKK